MDNEVKWIVGGFLVFFGMLIGACVYGDSQTHLEKLECMKARGEWVGKGCIFRDAKPQ